MSSLKLRVILLSLALLPLFSNAQNALNFDGVDDQITCGDVDLLSFTMEAWVKTSSSGNQTIFSKGDGNGNGENYIFQIQNGKVALYMYQSGTTAWYMSTNTIPNNTWCHVAVTYDNTTRINSFYINGIFNGSFVRASADPYQDNSSAYIGRQGYACNCNFFNGEMDELRIWNKVLSCEEINSGKYCQLVGTESGLTAYYKFNEGVAGGNNTGISTLTDSRSGSPFNGTVTNFTRSGTSSNWVVTGANVTGTCGATTTREINLIGNGNTIADGGGTLTDLDHTHYSIILPGQNVVRTYTIENTGTGDLTVSDITVTGPDAAMFVRSAITFPLTVAAGNSTTFTVTFTPVSTGIKDAQVNIFSDDCDENTYDFLIRGEGGFPGAALNFNGTASVVKVNYNAPLTMSDGNFAVEFWARPTLVNSDHHWVVAKDNGNGDLDYLVGIATNNKWTFICRNLSVFLTSTTVAVPGTYYHIACVLNGSQAFLYVNGVLEASTSSVGSPTTNTSDVVIGARTASAPEQFFEGDIDEVRFWNRALCLGEINNNKNCEIPTVGNGLVANYHFNDGVAAGINYGLNLLSDASGNGFDGNLYSFVYVGPNANWTAPGGVTTGISCALFNAPEISVEGNGNVIAFDGTNIPTATDNTDFGSTIVGNSSDKSFVIQNPGAATLNLTGSTTYVTIAGSSDFTLFSDANASIISGGNTNFTIRFTPSSAGLKTAVVTVLNDDCDESGYTFNIKATGTSSGPGQVLDFDGVDDYIETGFLPTAAVMNNFTLECWVKGDAAPQVGFNVYHGPIYGSKAAIIWDHQNGSFYQSASVTAADGSYGTASFGPLSGNVWYHLAATYDGTTLKSYKNGVLQNSITTTGGIAEDPTTLKIGSHPNTSNPFPHNFPGKIDEVKVWSRALSAAEITASMNCELTGLQACLELYYKFNQGTIDGLNTSETNVTDYSGKGRHGTFNNFALSTANSNFTSGTTVSGSCTPVFYPEIDLKGNGLSIVSGDNSPDVADSTDFGSVDVASGANINTFSISNFGVGSTLNLSGTPRVSISGSSDFTLDTDAGVSSLGSFASTTFKILFNPSSVGLQTATVTVQNDDCDEKNYSFTVQGTGTRPGAALDFDGTDFISLSNSNDFNFDVANSFTVEFWFRTTSNGQHVIFSTMTNAAPYNGYEISLQGGQLNFMMCSNFSTSNYLNVTANNILNNNIWHHGAVVYKGIADVSQIEIYIDEVLQTLTPNHNGLTNLLASSNVAHIGARGNVGQSFHYFGALDEIRIWNRALCSAELNSFNNCEVSGTSSGLVGYYNFNSGFVGENNATYTTLTDIAGGNNSGTLNSFGLTGFVSNWIDAGGVTSGTTCGALLEAEIDVRGNGISIISPGNTPTTNDNTHFGNVQTGSNKTLNYRIFNTGSATLNYITNPAVTISGSADFSVALQPFNSAVGVGGSSIIGVQFAPSVDGIQTAVVSILSNDCSEPEFTFTISGIGVPPPEINVKQNLTNIPDAGSFNFGNKVVNTSASATSFTIENLSSGGKLALKGIPQKVSLTGTNASSFVLNLSALPDSINPSSSANFFIQFMPTSAGAKTAQIVIENDDPDEPSYKINLLGNGVVAGDLDSNGVIGAGEIAGDTSGNGSIEFPNEVTGDVNGNGSIGTGEIAGDNDGDGQIDNGEIAGNTNGTGGIDNGEFSGDIDGSGGINGTEFTGDVNGNGVLDAGEFIGDVDGDGVITLPEVLGDINGDGVADPLPSYVLVGQGTIVTNYVSRYTIQPELPPYFTYAWVFSDESLFMIKDTTRYFMDVVANNQTNNGILRCFIYRFGVPYDTLEFTVAINKNYLNIAELAALTAECAEVANPANVCQESFIDYFKLSNINYDGSGCVRGGYQDLTASGYTTDLEMGFTYTVELKPNKLLFFPNPQDPTKNDTTTVFYALWIDYNNDGDFEDFAEYVKNGDSKSASTKLINITIANNNIYEGSRRLRVGMKTGSGFTASDACGINAVGTSGELEDYLITLVPMGALQAPNFLSPNNDGDNDLFSIKGVNAEKTRVLTIINKAGSVVYKEENYGSKELWGGKDSKGELLPKGTYYYIFENGSEELRSFLEIDY